MANDTSSYREHGSCPLSLAFHVGLAFVLFVICVSGLLGNTATLLTIGLTRSLHTVPNAYIANLAVIGLLVCIVLVPFTAVGYMTYVTQNVCKVMAFPNFSYMAVLLYRYVYSRSEYSAPPPTKMAVSTWVDLSCIAFPIIYCTTKNHNTPSV